MDLDGPDFFTCQKYNARLRRTVCVARQAARTRSGDNPYPGCQDCGQGREVRKEEEMVDTEKKIRTCRIEGCDRPAHARGVCKRHYDAWRRGEIPELGAYRKVRDTRGDKPPGPRVTLDFAGREDLLQRLRDQARDQYRTPEMQALWLLRRALEAGHAV